MAVDRSRSVRGATFVLLALSSMATEIAAVDVRPVTESLGLAAVWLVAALVASRFVPAPQGAAQRLPRAVLLVTVGLGAAPFLVEPLRREWMGQGYPLELQMVLALRNVGLGLAAAAAWPSCVRLSAVASLFLMLFAAAMTTHPAVAVLLGLYTLAGGRWLMMAGSIVRGSSINAAQTMPLAARGRDRRRPWLAAAPLIGVAACGLALLAIGPSRRALAIGEWLPTSGGTGGYDPFARGGINDGDDEVSGANARSTGMTPTDTFIESPLPSLYDAANDMYGPPHKPKERQESIAIGMTKMLEAGRKTPDNLRPSRSFSTARKGPEKPMTPLSRNARAIFEVEGRTPLYVRAVAFDRFDGRDWHEAPMHETRAIIEKERDGNWMHFMERDVAVFAEPEFHAFKLAAPEGSLIPTPPHVKRFRVGQVNRPGFFDWAQDHVLAFAHRKAPSGIVVETESRTVDPARLAAIGFHPERPGPARSSASGDEYLAVPLDLNPAVASLAGEWAAGSPEGWPQIAAVVERLRNDYHFDRSLGTPADADPLSRFLFDSHSGPDYEFATAAALMLRLQGHRTRLVSGFYVHPDHYDPESEHTPVTTADLHFWPEVRLPNGDWLVIEPTPGYEIPPPRRSLSARLREAGARIGGWAARNAITLSAVAVAIVVIAARRKVLLDAMAMLLWRCFPGRTWREQVRRGLHVLERRGRWAGRPRAPSQTVAAWLALAHPGDGDLNRLAEIATWAAYSPNLPPPWGISEPGAVCNHVLNRWTLRRWRAIVAQSGRREGRL